RATLMIADKGFLHSNWPADFDRRQRHSYDGYAVQEAGLKRRSTISHPRVEPHDLASWGCLCLGGERQRLIVSARAPRHCPAPSAAYRAEAECVCLRSPLLAVFQVMVTPARSADDIGCRAELVLSSRCREWLLGAPRSGQPCDARCAPSFGKPRRLRPTR